MGNYQHGIAFELEGYGSIVRSNITCGNGRLGLLIFDSGSSYNVIIGNSIGIGADGTTVISNQEGHASMGGGVGGAFYNVFGGKSEDLRNEMDRPYEGRCVMVGELYDTVFDGKVCKYMGMDRY